VVAERGVVLVVEDSPELAELMSAIVEREGFTGVAAGSAAEARAAYQRHRPVAVLLESDELWVRVFVPETRLGHVKVGQAVDIAIDTFPKRAFKALVQSVSERAEYTPRNVQTPEQRQDQVFAVRLRLDPAPELKAGMTATVRFE